jgi:hypothetical protein
MSRSIVAIGLPFLLGACTTLYPPLYSAPTIAATAEEGTLKKDCQGHDDPLDQTLACAEILQDVYSTGYQDSAKWQDISQLPIIGAAGAAAWILLKDEENAARKAGKIFIGTGVYSAARNQLFPKNLPETFIQGHSALGCVIAEKVYFRGDTAVEAFDALNQSLLETADLATLLSWLRYKEPSDSASAELLKAARALADQAIAAANTQLGASRKERAAYKFAPSPFRQSVSDIAAWVASKGRARPNASYDDLLKGMSSSPKAEPGTEAPLAGVDPLENARSLAAANERPTAAQLIEAIGEVSQKLSSKTIELQGNTPPYAARLVKVTECATKLPA